METGLSSFRKDTDEGTIQFRTSPKSDGHYNDPPLIQFGPGKKIYVLGFEVMDEKVETLNVEKLVEGLNVFLSHVIKDMLDYSIKESSIEDIVVKLHEHGKYGKVLDSSVE